METITKPLCHWEVLEMTLPNNRVMAEKRAHYLKRKFQKDQQYFSHYKELMNEIIEKGYARVSDRTQVDGKLWYLPHHGVYHPAKFNKTRVIFDYSATYAGRFINKKLFVGPDLTNYIIGILIKLRQEIVAGFRHRKDVLSSFGYQRT